MGIAFRSMEVSDLGAVLRIEAASFRCPWSAEMFRDELVQPLGWREVAVSPEGTVIGFLVGRRYPDVWHVMDFAVSPLCRRQGVARQLLRRFAEEADAAGMSLMLEVRQRNTAALALYKQLGFVAVGKRKGYYADTREDALVMARGPTSQIGGLGRRGRAWGGDVNGDAASGPAAELPAELDGPLLAIETSCDDSAAAVLTARGDVLASVVHSQDAIHERYGGVVPEVASRAHVERLTVVVREALRQAGCQLEDLGGVAATVGPGLIGALLVGVQTAKTLAWARRLPFFPVNHIHGHLAAVWLSDREAPFPVTTLVASGGHTALVLMADRAHFRVLGQTLDDAAGEAFDKGARLLGLGYPGGRELDELAESGDPDAYRFPIGLKRSRRPDFSFSGVKTALYYLLRDMSPEERVLHRPDIAASYRKAIVDALIDKAVRTADDQNARTLAIVGGVAANSLLRRTLFEAGQAAGRHVVIPPLAYCTDNAAMIGAAALTGPVLRYPDYLDVDASSSLGFDRWGTTMPDGEH